MNNQPIPPTKIIALDHYFGQSKNFIPTEDDKQTAQFIIDEIKKIDNKNFNDYIWNLQSIVEKEYITVKEIGFLASAVKFVMKSKTESNKTEQKESVFVGSENEKLTMMLKPILISPFESQWGRGLMIRFEDENGNILVWFSTSSKKEDYQLDVFDKFSFTVKKHEQFKGINQTLITRVKVSK